MSTFSNNPIPITLEEINSRKGTEWYESRTPSKT